MSSLMVNANLFRIFSYHITEVMRILDGNIVYLTSGGGGPYSEWISDYRAN